MKKLNFLKNLLSILIYLVTPSAFSFSLTDLSVQLQQPKHIQGKFVQLRYLHSLTNPLQTEGIFALKPKYGLYWQTNKPFEVRLRVYSSGIEQWNTLEQNWQSTQKNGQTEQIKLFMALLAGDMHTLEQHFNISLTGHAQHWQLTLQPKTIIMKKIFAKIEIEGNQYLQQITLFEKQGDKTILKFNSITQQPLPSFINQALL